MKQKKGAIELSMTTIIVIVLGVTLLILGLAFIQSLFKETMDIQNQLFITAEKMIQEKMSSSTKFYISGLNYKIESGKSTDAFIGIQNFEEEAEFQIMVESGENENVADWFVLPPKQTIKNGDKKGLPIIIKVPKGKAPGSSATFTINALRDGELYDSQAIVIVVQE